MQIQVEIDGNGREVLCEVEHEYELVAVNSAQQWLVDDFRSNATIPQQEKLGEQIDAAWAEHRQERADFIKECERDERIYNASNRQT